MAAADAAKAAAAPGAETGGAIVRLNHFAIVNA
jgi:hypothetical protein